MPAGFSICLPFQDRGDPCCTSTYLFVAVNRCSRSVRLTHGLTDNGSCFTPAFAKACKSLGTRHRHTKTNGIVERFNGRIGPGVLGNNTYSHRVYDGHLERPPTRRLMRKAP